MQFQKESLIKIILQGAEKTIPKTSSDAKRRPPVVWWNKECEREERIVRAEYENINETQQTELNQDHYKVGEPLNRVFRKVRKNTWNKFINSLNFRTPTKEVWDKFKKVIKNYKPRIISPLESEGNIITSPEEIADTFADHYANILRDPYKNKPEKTRKKKSYHIINHSQAEN